jgi:hypothetical protein
MDGNDPRPGQINDCGRGVHRRKSSKTSDAERKHLDKMKSTVTKRIKRRRNARHFETMTDADRRALVEEAIKSGKVHVTKCPERASYL